MLQFQHQIQVFRTNLILVTYEDVQRSIEDPYHRTVSPIDLNNEEMVTKITH